MFKWYTLCPFFLAISEYGTNFMMGDSGICWPFNDIFGMLFNLVVQICDFFSLKTIP
jgi:hypothetical protein